MKRSSRLALTALLIGLAMMADTRPAFSSNGIVSDVIICANEIGETREFQVGWDPSNRYFEGQGDIPRLFCEGGHAGNDWRTFVSSTLAENDPRRYYNGVIPVPSPSVEPEPTPLPSLSPEPTIEPTPTPTEPTQIEPTPELPPEPSPTPSQSREQEIVPIPAPTPSTSTTAEPTPTPTPTPSLTDEPSPTPIPSAPSQSEPTPTPTITQRVSIELSPSVAAIPGALQLVAAAEAIMNIGADMTDEERQEAQTVAVSALIVTQLAQVRKIK